MIELTCKFCKKQFKVYRYRAKSANYCSYVCKGKDQSTKYLGDKNPCYRGGKPNCQKCGKKCYNRDAKYCGECSRSEDIRNWKGGIYVNNKKEYKAKKYKEWVTEFPEKRYLTQRDRRIRELNAEGSHTYQEWLNLCKAYKYMCLCCKRTDVKLTEDHIAPLSKGGTDYIWNIQPLCGSCNSIKRVQTINYRERLVS